MSRLFDLRMKRALRPGASIEDLEAFTTMIEESDAKRSTTWQTVAMLYLTCRTSKLPGPGDELNFFPGIVRIWMRKLQVMLEKRTNPEYYANIRDHWETLWPWLSYLVRRDNDCMTKLLSVDIVLGRYKDGMGFLDMLVSQPDLRPVIGSTPDMLPVLIHVWQRETVAEAPFVSASRIIKHLLTPPATDQSPPDWTSHCRHLPQRLGDLAGDFTTACLQRLDVVDPSESVLQLLSDDLAVLCSCTRNLTIHRRFLAKSSVNLVLRLTRHMTLDSIAENDPKTTKADVFEFAIHYLQWCCQIDGLPLILQILDGRLLVTVFKLVHRLKGQNPGIDKASVALIRTLIPFLVYRPVLRHARRSLKTIAISQSPVSMGKFGNASVSFRAFQEVVIQRTELKRIFDMDASAASCQNAKHDSLPPTNRKLFPRPMRCGRCYHAHYCSLECRNEDWEKRHKQECLQIVAKRREGLPDSSVSSRDQGLLRLAALVDTQESARQLQDKRDAYLKKFPQINPKSLILQVDHTTFPMNISVVPVTQYDKEGITGDNWRSALDKVEAGGQSLFCALVPGPHGPEPYRIVYSAEEITKMAGHFTGLNGWETFATLARLAARPLAQANSLTVRPEVFWQSLTVSTK